MSSTVTLRKGPCEAVFSSFGAEMMEWRIGGRNLVFDGDARWWPRRSPILFPFCGWLKDMKFRAKGREFPTNTHGFGRETDFAIEQTGAASARLTLQDTPALLEKFPYRFHIAMTATLTDNGIALAFEVTNPGDEPLPFALGYHPGFVWPFDGGAQDDYVLEFDAQDDPDVPVIAPFGLFTDRTMRLPYEGRRLSPVAALAMQDSQCIMNTKSQRCDFIAPSGRRIRVETRNFPHWVIWRKPDGPYLCIERWSGQGDPVDFAGDITEKPGMTLLPPGARATYAFDMSYL